jgi:hypothetical protein
MMRVRILFLLLLLAVWAPSDASAQVARLYPVDEAVQQPDFFSFRARLLLALQARDTAFLYAALAPNILNSFGGDGGVAEFRQKWRPGEPGSEVWRVLTEVLALGGSFHADTLFIAPTRRAAFRAISTASSTWPSSGRTCGRGSSRARRRRC